MAAKKQTAEKKTTAAPGKADYVAYVSSYTRDLSDKFGIRIYDVDLVNGRMSEKEKVQITNSSYITASRNGKNLYSITDRGVESYKITKEGLLEPLNDAPINGMRTG